MAKPDIPDGWRSLDVDTWRGPVLVLGASDTGKSTFARYLCHRLAVAHRRIAYIDGDVGQSHLGPPATLTLALSGDEEEPRFPPGGLQRLWFVGSNSPTGHMLTLVTGLDRLAHFAAREGALATVVDTTGLVNPGQGGAALKWAVVDLLRPCTIVGFQRREELEPILGPLRRLPDLSVHTLPVAAAVRERSREDRIAHRAARYWGYFKGARRVSLTYGDLAVFPRIAFSHGRLVALEDREGFALALGVVDRAREGRVWLYTPWQGDEEICALRLGDLRLDLNTFKDARI
jgi:polynucleotide 5'-hydroxyl-kinase GRC3/NOL9